MDAALGADDDLGLPLGQIHEHPGERRGLPSLLTERVLSRPTRGGVGSSLVARPPAERRQQPVDVGLFPGLHWPNGSVGRVRDDCVFCRILAGELPSTEVLSTETTYAFRDIKPGAPVHVLIIPRAHIENAAAIQPEHAELLADLLLTAQRVAEKEQVAASGYRLVFNVGEDALNSIPHLHLHLVGGRRLGWPPG
jgi:histidine triad (HIT) family protein